MHARLAVLALVLPIAPPPAPAAQPLSSPAPTTAPGDGPRAVDFARDVRPILQGRCTRCHGGERPKAGLRLDDRTAALAATGAGTTPVIVPGDARASELLVRVAHSDPDERMPPEGAPLTPAELELLERWITAGATWPEDETAALASHWAYVPPIAPVVPADPFGTGPWEPARTAIDHFVRARLAAEGLEPAPPADRATLIRRASLDLTGLPPAPADVAAFLADESPDAWEQVVDRLLASPHCAEHLARHWLDLARYADTNGYEKDGGRTMWRWRDWVIDAFDRDMPLDEMAVRQLAGDLLPEATLADRIATGFHRNTMTNLEGGVDPEEFRVDAVVDRVNTTAAVWLGTTLACAQCHDHKFDPFTQRDYYGLFAFFNSTADDGRSNEPRIEAPTIAQLARRPAVLAEIAAAEERLAAWTPALQAELDVWIASVRAGALSWTALRPVSAEASEGSRLGFLNDGSVIAFGELVASDVYTIEAPLAAEALPAGELRALRLDVLTDESLPGGGPGRPGHGNFVLSELRAWLAEPGAAPEPLELVRARADHEQTDGRYPAQNAIDGDRATGWAIGGGIGAPHQLVLELAAPVAVPRSARLVVEVDQAFGAEHLIGRLRLAVSGAAPPPDAVLARPDLEELARSSDTPGSDTPGSDETGSDDAEALRAFWRERSPLLGPDRARLTELASELDAPTALVLRELDEPRPTHLLVRGSFLSLGEPVEPAVPELLHAWPTGAPPNRLGFARWLVTPTNPLTPRVCANRLWAWTFGRGLVPTLEDFGLQGEPPSHPELLDHLALELVQDGWSAKRALRRIALSATYRQAAAATPALRERDPDNALLARGPRGRVDAETVRDVALAVSGLLDRTTGGPSVYPDQPDGIWRSTYSGDRWATSPGGDRWRRGLYTFWKRTAPYPSFAAFDAPSRELACTRRPRTNTPLQALVLLNDPAFVRAAGALAERMCAEAGPEPTDRARHGFLLCTAREPTERELAVLLDLFAAERAGFAQDPERARALLGEPDKPTEPPESPDFGGLADRAAWTLVANTLLNLDETITKP